MIKEPILKKSVFRIITVILPAGSATSGAPLGPMLAQFAVNTITFCKEFNDKTNVFLLESNNSKIDVLVELTIYEDKSFSFLVKKPVISFLVKSLIKHKYFILLSDLIKILIFYYGPHLEQKKFKKRFVSLIGSLSSMNVFLIKSLNFK